MSGMFTCRLDDNTELRLLEPRDAGALYELVDHNRAHLRQWLHWIDLCQSVEDRQAAIQQNQHAWAEDGTIFAGIWHQGRLAGVAGTRPVHQARIAYSLFYFLGEDFQGKGLITSSCRAIISHLFDRPAVHRIEIWVATGNARSRAVASRLGFTHEGTQRQAFWLYDHFVDLDAFALLRQEWERKTSDV